MKENRSKNVKKALFIVLTIIVVLVLIAGGYFIFVKNGNVRNRLITKENYTKITEQVTEQLKDSDDAYYFIYACINYMSKSGLTEEYLNSKDDDLLYKDIYNKTVQNLINEGKTMLDKDGRTLEEFKNQVDIINNLNNNSSDISDEIIDENEVNKWIEENNSLISGS